MRELGAIHFKLKSLRKLMGDLSSSLYSLVGSEMYF